MAFKRSRLRTRPYRVTIDDRVHRFESYTEAERFADEHGGARIQTGSLDDRPKITPERKACLDVVRARDGLVCWMAERWPEVECWGDLDGHELFPRGRGGDECDPDNVRLVCRRHHRAAHDNPKLAEQRGCLLPTRPGRGRSR